MAVRNHQISVTVPAGTTQAAPLVTPWLTEDNIVQYIELEIPPGHNGFTGIRVMKGDVQLVPWGTNIWIVANDYTARFEVDDYVPTADVNIETYNNGAYAHTFFLRMAITDLPTASQAAVPTESSVLNLGQGGTLPDPLSPDAILGSDTASALASGQLTADQVAPISSSDLTQPPSPMPK